MLVMPTRRLLGTLLSLHISHQRDAIEPSRDKPLQKMHRSIPKAKKHCFSAKSDSRTGITRRSDGLRRCNRGSTKFNTFAETIFLRLPRSCRVAEKSDPIDRFSGPDLQKITKNRWFLSNFSTTRHDRAKRRKTYLANVSKRRLPNLQLLSMPERRMVRVPILHPKRRNSPTTFLFCFFFLHNITKLNLNSVQFNLVQFT